MNSALVDKLIEVRKSMLRYDSSEEVYKYHLADFSSTERVRYAIPDSPFRAFPSVPQDYSSKRKQNNTIAFDPYRDTLFDYPLVVKHLLQSPLQAVEHFNYHLTVQLPSCGMDCWHCYNDKQICAAGFTKGKIKTNEYTAQQVLESFVKCKKNDQIHHYNILRISGGEPFLVPELIAELLKIIHRKGDPDYPQAIWTETNLLPWIADDQDKSVMTQALVEAKNNGLDMESIFSKMCDRIVVHPCFHGLTDDNLNKCSIPVELRDQAKIKFADLISGFDSLQTFPAQDKPLHLYPTFITEACDPDGVANLFKQLYKIDPTYVLKVALISTDLYEPVQIRLHDRATSKDLPRVYARHASLHRWRSLLKHYFDNDYAQIVRPLASSVAQNLTRLSPTNGVSFRDYEPCLILMKSTYRNEYKQELLSIIGGPPNIKVVASYDVNHIEPSTLTCLNVGLDAISPSGLKGIVVYTDANTCENAPSHVPLREVHITKLEITERLVHIEMLLGDYLVPEGRKFENRKDSLRKFKERLLDYYGTRNLTSRAEASWVLLGEKSLLLGDDKILFRNKGQVSTNSFNSEELSNAWDELLDLLTKLKEAAPLCKNSIFLQLLPDFEPEVVGNGELGISLHEGEIAPFHIRHYIHNFDIYDKDIKMRGGRTLTIASPDSKLRVANYSPKPLPKYGELSFQVVCDEIEKDIPSVLTIESTKQSCDCPSWQLNFSLKKKQNAGATR